MVITSSRWNCSHWDEGSSTGIISPAPSEHQRSLIEQIKNKTWVRSPGHQIADEIWIGVKKEAIEKEERRERCSSEISFLQYQRRDWKIWIWREEMGWKRKQSVGNAGKRRIVREEKAGWREEERPEEKICGRNCWKGRWILKASKYNVYLGRYSALW